MRIDIQRLIAAARWPLLIIASIATIAAAWFALTSAPTPEAHAASDITVYENKGVYKARLGMSKDTAIKYLKQKIKLTRQGRDDDYAGQVVYYAFFGKKQTGGYYSLEMYSNRKKKAYMFQIADKRFVTSRGVRVGTSEATLKSKYKGKLRRTKGDVYTKYTWKLSNGVGTDFYVRQGKIKHFVVRDF